MPDKTAFEISGELHQYIEDLVKRVVLDGKPFDDKEKKWLQRYSLMEGLDHEALENSLMAFLETIGGLNYHTHKPLERFLKPLSLQAAECFVSESLVSDIIKRKREIGEKEEHQAQKNIKLLRDDSTFKLFPNIQKELMTYAYREDFYTTFFLAYKKPLEELLGYINHISDLLKAKDVRQSDEYSQLSSEADSFFKRAQKAQCCEIETIRTEGGELKEKIKGFANKAKLIRDVSDLLLDKEVGQSKEFGKFSEEVNLFIERVIKTPYNELDAINKEGRELKEGIANKARLIRDISSLLEVKKVRQSKEFAKFSEEVDLFIERVIKTPNNELDAINKEGREQKNKARLIRDISSLLEVKEVRQSKEFGKFSEEVNLFIEHVRKTPYNELDAINKEGRELKEGIANKARLIRDIFSLLEVKEVRQSKEFGKFSEEVNLFIERVRKTPNNELDAINKEGEKLKKQGEKILNQTKKKNDIVKRALITIVSTIVVILLWVLCFNWSVDDESFVASLKGMFVFLLFNSSVVIFFECLNLFYLMFLRITKSIRNLKL